MKRRKLIKRAAMLVTALSVAIGSAVIPVSAENGAGTDTGERTVAFNGAEGGGMYTKGARAALDNGDKIEVYHVTSLADDGEGSFREAVSKGNRIVVFDVSGMINLTKNVSIGHDNITILGQTAPGNGVTFRGDNIKVGADNVILRYLRFRVGAQHLDGTVTPARDGLEVTDDCQNVIIDHCSVSWGTDENLSAYAVKDVTIQNCIIAEALNQSVHDKGEHSYGAIWGGVNLSVHHNLIATHKSRNPKIGTSETVAMTAGYTDAQTLVDMKNNIFYNWGDKAGYGTENGAKTYIQNNIYKPGPATPAGKRARIFELSVGQKYQTNMLGSVYAVGNKIDVDESDTDYADAQTVNAENWQDDLHTGVYVDNKFYSNTDKSNMKIEVPDAQYQEYNAEYPITLDETDDVYEDILENAGATLPKRDLVDARIVDNVRNRTAPTGSKGSVGLVDDPADGVPEGQEDLYDALGYPKWAEETRDASYDTDGDGIPDEWETKMRLNPKNPLDGVKLGPDGLTWLEIYVAEAIEKPESELSFGTMVSTARAVYTNEETELWAFLRESSKTKIISYHNGTAELYTDDSFAGGVAAAVYYDSAGVMREVKTAEVDAAQKGNVSIPVGEVTWGNVRVYLWDSLENMTPLCREYVVPTGDLELAEPRSFDVDSVEKVQFYCNEDVVAETTEYAGDKWKAVVSGLPTGENEICARIIMKDGSSVLSGTSVLAVTGIQQPGDWINSVKDNMPKAGFDGECYTIPRGRKLYQIQTDPFKIVTKLKDITARYNGVETGLQLTGPAGEVIKLHKSMDNYQPKICYRIDEERGAWSDIDADKIEYLEIAVENGKVTLYAGENLATLENNVVYTKTFAEPLIGSEVSAYVAGRSEYKAVSKLDMLKIVTEETHPKAVLNAEDGDRLLLEGETVTVDVQADSAAPVTEVWLFMDGKPYMSKQVHITGSETVEFPVSFDTTQEAQLTAYVFDENLGKGISETKNVLISMDPAPWVLTDIGSGETESRSYVSVTPDYTVKLADTSNGQIGGSADQFAFFNQQFSRNMRMYYRSRMQSAEQFGAVIKSDLTPDCETYFFGGTRGEDGKPVYQLMKRESGGEMTVVADVTEVTGQSANLYFIVEKNGDKINIYQTENGATVYQTEKLLASVDCSSIGGDYDTYYMGFGAVGGAGNPADAGWLGMESFNDYGEYHAVGCSFGHGLDWLWQIQEPNVLSPVWDAERCAMKLSTDSEYTSPRYVFREYKRGDGNKVITARTYITLTGEKPGLNIYLNANNKDEAFKAELIAGEPVVLGGVECDYIAETGTEYTLEITVDEGKDPNTAAMVIYRELGPDDFPDAVTEEAQLQPFRAQNNVEKKTPVTNGIFFEPKENSEGSCYISGMEIGTENSAIQKNIISEHFWNFGSSEEFAGLTALANGGEYAGLNVIGGAEIQSKNKSIDGVNFAARYKIGGSGSQTSKCVYFDVPAGTTDIVVYGESASSSEQRGIVIDDGEKHETLVTEAQSASYSFTSDEDKRIYVYGSKGINLYGISYQTYTMSE